MRSYVLLVCLSLLALPALAVTPQAGDIVLVEHESLNPGTESRLVLLAPSTGDRTVISCWDDCVVPIGSGPPIKPGFAVWGVTVGPDGAIYVASPPDPGPDPGPITTILYRFDVVTGDWSIVTSEAEADLYVAAFTVWPAPSFFPPTVASLGGWGLATLVIGIAIGVQVRAGRA